MSPDQIKIASAILVAVIVWVLGYLFGRAHESMIRQRKWKRRWKGSPWV